jgi:hypothetical protein
MVSSAILKTPKISGVLGKRGLRVCKPPQPGRFGGYAIISCITFPATSVNLNGLPWKGYVNSS